MTYYLVVGLAGSNRICTSLSSAQHIASTQLGAKIETFRSRADLNYYLAALELSEAKVIPPTEERRLILNITAESDHHLCILTWPDSHQQEFKFCFWQRLIGTGFQDIIPVVKISDLYPDWQLVIELESPILVDLYAQHRSSPLPAVSEATQILAQAFKRILARGATLVQKEGEAGCPI